jgi:hypothetical protein
MRQVITTAHRVGPITHAQYAVSIEHREAFEEALERLGIQLSKCPNIEKIKCFYIIAYHEISCRSSLFFYLPIDKMDLTPTVDRKISMDSFFFLNI